MPYLDLLLAIPLIWGMYRGFTRGFIVEICTLMALILGIYGAAMFGERAGDSLELNYNTDPQMGLIIAFAALFIIIIVVVFIFGKVLEGVIKMVALGLVNKLFGLLFGGLKFALILSGILYVLNGIPGTKNLIPVSWKADSYLYEPLAQFAPTIYPILKEESWREDLIDRIDALQKDLTE